MWIQHPRFKDYIFHTDGRVASLKYGRWRDLCVWVDNTGYWFVGIKRKNRTVHRLLAEAYYGPSKLHVNHIDGDPLNNSVDNLEYCTNASNVYHAWMIGRHEKTREAARQRRGERSPHCKKSDAEVAEILSWRGTITQTEAATRCGMSRSWVGLVWSEKLRRT